MTPRELAIFVPPFEIHEGATLRRFVHASAAERFDIARTLIARLVSVPVGEQEPILTVLQFLDLTHEQMETAFHDAEPQPNFSTQDREIKTEYWIAVVRGLKLLLNVVPESFYLHAMDKLMNLNDEIEDRMMAAERHRYAIDYARRLIRTETEVVSIKNLYDFVLKDHATLLIIAKILSRNHVRALFSDYGIYVNLFSSPEILEIAEAQTQNETSVFMVDAQICIGLLDPPDQARFLNFAFTHRVRGLFDTPFVTLEKEDPDFFSRMKGEYQNKWAEYLDELRINRIEYYKTIKP